MYVLRILLVQLIYFFIILFLQEFNNSPPFTRGVWIYLSCRIFFFAMSIPRNPYNSNNFVSKITILFPLMMILSLNCFSMQFLFIISFLIELFINAQSLRRTVTTSEGKYFLMHELIIIAKLEFISLIFSALKSSFSKFVAVRLLIRPTFYMLFITITKFGSGF